MGVDFFALHLIINNESPSVEDLTTLFENNVNNFSLKDTHYLIEKENINNEYFWIYARYGKSLPYSSTVYNTNKEMEENNPRMTSQVEPSKQLFGLYSVKDQVLHLSNKTKISLLEEYIRFNIEKDTTIKAFYKDIDSFIEQIRSIEKVKFVAKSNLFNSEGEILKIFPSPKDLYGLGMPDEFSLEAKFSNASLTQDFIEKLKKMVGWKNNAEMDSLVCVGRDDHNFETVFNGDSFTQKIFVSAGKDDQGMYDPEVVKQTLISELSESQDG
jgi:hypothetical protein